MADNIGGKDGSEATFGGRLPGKIATTAKS
jgi:hypothetical protein